MKHFEVTRKWCKKKEFEIFDKWLISLDHVTYGDSVDCSPWGLICQKKVQLFHRKSFLFRVVASLPSTDGCVNSLCNLVQYSLSFYGLFRGGAAALSAQWRNVIMFKKRADDLLQSQVQQPAVWPQYRVYHVGSFTMPMYSMMPMKASMLTPLCGTSMKCQVTHTSIPLKILICVPVRFKHHNVNISTGRISWQISVGVDSTIHVMDESGVQISQFLHAGHPDKSLLAVSPRHGWVRGPWRSLSKVCQP